MDTYLEPPMGQNSPWLAAGLLRIRCALTHLTFKSLMYKMHLLAYGILHDRFLQHRLFYMCNAHVPAHV